MNQRGIFRAYLLVVAVGSLFWWPLSHWFYPDWYHTLLGFDSYADAYVKVIGTLSLMPVLGMGFVALNPEKNRDFFVALLAFSVLMAGTYVYLIIAGDFPPLEYVNVGIILGNAAILSALYPWREAAVPPI